MHLTFSSMVFFSSLISASFSCIDDVFDLSSSLYFSHSVLNSSISNCSIVSDSAYLLLLSTCLARSEWALSRLFRSSYAKLLKVSFLKVGFYMHKRWYPIDSVKHKSGDVYEQTRIHRALWLGQKPESPVLNHSAALGLADKVLFA